MFDSAGLLNELPVSDKPSHSAAISVIELWGEEKLRSFLLKSDLWDAYKHMQKSHEQKKNHARFHLSKPGTPSKMDENIQRRVTTRLSSLRIKPDVSYTSIMTSTTKEDNKVPKSRSLKKKFKAFNSLLTYCDDLFTSNQPIQKACSTALTTVKVPVKPKVVKKRRLTRAEKRKIEEYMRVL